MKKKQNDNANVRTFLHESLFALRMDKAFVAMQYFAGNNEYFMGQRDIIMLLYKTNLFILTLNPFI